MHKLTPKMIFTLVLLTAGMNAHAGDVGVVDMGYLINNAPQAEAASRELEESFGPEQRRMQEKQQEYQELVEQLEKDELVMEEQERQETRQRLQELQQEMQQMEQRFREELGAEREQAFGRIQQLVAEIVDEMAEEEGFDVVVTQGVLYASESANLTDRVLERMEQRFEE